MNHLTNGSGGHCRAKTFTRPLSLALLGVCVAGLALPAFAQSPTAADVERMLAEFDVQHQRTLELIEEAKAAVKPASAFAHLPPDSVPLEAYLGKTLLSVESGFAMYVDGPEQGSLRVAFVNIDATPVGGFALGPKQSMATATHTLYDLRQIAFGDCPANGQPRTGSVHRDGSGAAYQWSCGGDRRGRGRQYYSYSLEPDGPGIKTTFVAINDQGVSNSSEHVYLPISDELLAATTARLTQRHEEERLRQEAIRMQQAEQAREARAAKAERSAERGALFGAVLQGLAQGTAEALADQQHADYVQEAMLVDLQRQTMQIQQAQAAEQQLAATSASPALRAPGGLRAQPVASEATPQAPAGITVAAVQTPPRQVDAPKAAAGVPGFLVCMVLKPGSFDRHNGAWFFSAIAPTTIVYGETQEDPRSSFLSRVRATYGITGGVPSCEKRESRAELQAHLDDIRASYSKHKHVQTGITP